MKNAKSKKEENLKALVDELLKEKPDNSAIKTLSNELNIPYSKDPVHLMSYVLDVVNQTKAKELC